ncbi:PH-like domain-containing protein [Streptomyces johnsoniae]|uniref:PH domain-containing protein n=1 Tax=Streptomyces johnsoniae TaxID=3075532 RepID=A0ABU2S250_9ACTN|nr:hypothetical protein [Streptomyces sp. DSM 41886]MDT0442771.1 hypothetical protein [Streptomyces sp. DSM 41886]
MTAALYHLLAEEQTERRSQEVTDWAARIGWIVGILFFLALVYWLMREGWKWRAVLQGDVPALTPAPAVPADPRLHLTGRYHGTTTAGQWLDRIVAHGLGARSRADVTLTDEGVTVLRPGAADFHIPAGRVRGARLDKGIAGKVLTEGGLLVITWEHGGRLLDSGFRADRAAEHAAWVGALGPFTPHEDPGQDHREPSDTRKTRKTRKEGAR